MALLLAGSIGGSLGGCLQSTGDFGRANTGVMHSRVLPAVGYYTSMGREDPVSDFPLTEQEKLLRALAWRLVFPAHGRDWIGHTAAEIQRTQIIHRMDLRLAPSRYSDLLFSDRYVSSEVRYARVAEDAATDAEGIAPFFAVVERVIADDEKRLRNAGALSDITPAELVSAYGRVEENRRLAAWVKRALMFRLYAYRYAFDRLLIKTPSGDEDLVRSRLDLLEGEIEGHVWPDDPPAAPIIGYDDPVDLMEVYHKG